jgi:hypothetical protein
LLMSRTSRTVWSHVTSVVFLGGGGVFVDGEEQDDRVLGESHRIQASSRCANIYGLVTSAQHTGRDHWSLHATPWMQLARCLSVSLEIADHCDCTAGRAHKHKHTYIHADGRERRGRSFLMGRETRWNPATVCC